MKNQKFTIAHAYVLIVAMLFLFGVICINATHQEQPAKTHFHGISIIEPYSTACNDSLTLKAK